MSQPRTLEEAATELRKSKRWLQDWLLENPTDKFGQPFYFKAGKSHRFREHDIARIKAELEALSRRATFIYFVEAAGHIKIGKAGNWTKRLSGIQSSLPVKLNRLLVLKAHVGFEVDLHEKFSAFRVRGEWFKDCAEIREFIERAALTALFVIGAEQ